MRGELVTAYDRWCVTCGAGPREKCRAVVRRDNGFGQEVKAPHRAREETRWGYSWVDIDCAQRRRLALEAVWG